MFMQEPSQGLSKSSTILRVFPIAPSAEIERALFDGRIQSVAVTAYQNERPFCGLAGLLDWRFHGAITKHILSGKITGKAGECVYLPMSRNGTTYHIILAGAGTTPSPGQRSTVPEETLQILKKNLISMRLPKIGISCSDFGYVTEDFFAKRLKGVPLWITQ